MHERYGLVKHTQDQAMRCARDGFAVLAPNFFFRHPDQKVLNAGDCRYDMTDPESVELIKAALAAVKNHKAADPSKVVVVGYCQTGRHPLVFAAEVPISAAVVWYGAAATREWEVNKLQPKPLDDVIAKLDCPVFGAFGEADHIISLDDVRRFRNSLEKHKKNYDIHIYKGAPHGWLNDTMPGRYRKAAGRRRLGRAAAIPDRGVQRRLRSQQRALALRMRQLAELRLLEERPDGVADAACLVCGGEFEPRLCRKRSGLPLP